MVLSKDLDALFWSSQRPEHVSAWHGHVSFAHWLVKVLRPRLTVELGTHGGVSFASFCNAVARCHVPGKCFAVDTWLGDNHAGHYGEDVYNDLSGFVAERFPSFATMLRCYFDDALAQFEDGSIELLHIDGLHTYEAVRHDFESWRAKLSDRAIVLFHDTEVRHLDFGVWRLWSELSVRFPSFNFKHSCGLGVLAPGASPPPELLALWNAATGADADVIRHNFALASEHARRSGSLELRTAASRRLAAIAAHRVNLALGRPGSQSSVYPGTPANPQGALDGIKNGKFGFHTMLERSPWFLFELSQSAPLDEIVIYNRLDSGCSDRARSLTVLVSEDAENWTKIYTHDGSPIGGLDGNPLRVNCGGTRARFIKISLRETQFLHLDEVEVYGTSISVA